MPSLVRPGPHFTPHDAVETAIVAALAEANHKRGPDAWLAVRSEVREHLMRGSDQLWIVMSARGNLTRVACAAADATDLASEARCPVYVVPLGEVITTARERFEDELKRVAGKHHDVHAEIRSIEA
jgi:hypothetical protein